jgi:poly(3-hydroxyalkanoate) synthetase
MGRKKKEESEKRKRLSISISKENFDKFEVFDISNKSSLIEWLLDQHFNGLKR